MKPAKRKPNRLATFDYSTVGAYFITICAKNRKPIFGQVVGGGVLDAPHLAPSPYGKIVAAQLETMSHFTRLFKLKNLLSCQTIFILLCR